jgi:NADP-dependent 3-hydroxy acid dehydrogenase YdfG
MLARRSERLEELEAQLNDERARRVHAIRCDVTEWNDCSAAAAEAVATYGRVDGLVNLAGAWVEGPFAEATPEEIRRFVDTDVLGATYLARAVLPAIRDAGGGRVLHINGLQGFIRQRPPVLYAAVESAARGLCESLRWEAAPYGVHVGLITLGSVASGGADEGSQPLHGENGQRIRLTSDEVAEAIVFSLSRPHGVNVDEVVLTPLGQEW